MAGLVLGLCVACGAGLGAVLRWLLSLYLPNAVFALGILVANALGAFLIGVLTPLLSDPRQQALLITGFLGGLTTFSSFSLEVLMLLQSGRFGQACFLIVAHLALSLSSTALGLGCANGLLAK